MSTVQLQHVSKVYPNGHRAVDDFHLDIADGEFVVFVGPSGCGKSTTLRLIAGLEEDFQGTILIDGRDVGRLPPKDRDIAMVFQNYALYPHMTAYTNMALPLKLRGMDRASVDKRVRETAALLGIAALLERRPGQLSGGQRQRVALGRAIVRQPKAFLFDEPLSNLDAKLRVSTRGEIKALHQRLKTTSIYVTHDQEEAMTLGDRIVVMAGGKIQQAATPLEVYRRPVNRFVAGFFGTPTMNFIDCHAARTPAGWACALARFSPMINVEESRARNVREGQPLVMGIRPQHLRRGSRDGCSSLPMTVRSVEILGDEVDLTGTVGDLTLSARVAAEPIPRIGDLVELCVDQKDVLLFEPGEFGRNLTL